MYSSKLILFLLFSSPCHSQIFGNQPWFRGVFSALPISYSDVEFFPAAKDILSRPVVRIKDGALRGFVLRTVDDRKISAFQSIPYAQPPVGNLRFSDPVKNLPWTGIRNARPRSPQCLQMDLARTPLVIHGVEDCLYLNCYVPERRNSNDSSLLPVMVFIHGGGYVFGAGSANGPRYLLDHDVILVTFNYRLSIFGFFSTGDDASPGNQALKDQVLALKWVKENIAAFGGDPQSITIAGQSAGAVAVGLHMVSPKSRGLFHRGISQSGSAMCSSWAIIPNAPATAREVGRVRKCPTNSTQEMVECLRKLPPRLLVTVAVELASWLVFPLLPFGPSVEHSYPGAFLTKLPEQYYRDGEAASVPWIAGLTRDEFGLITSVVMKAPPLVIEINKEWERRGWLIMNAANSEEFPPETMKKIWSFYMGDEKLSWETKSNFSQLISDRFMVQCTLEGMRYHSMYTKQPVYGYVLSYLGRYSTVQIGGARPQDYGVVHNDELIYLMNNPDWYPTLSHGDPELEMSRLMTSMWSNFAISGRPHLKWRNITLDIWQPIQPVNSLFSPIRLFNLTLNPQMIDDPYVKRYNFWTSEIYGKSSF